MALEVTGPRGASPSLFAGVDGLPSGDPRRGLADAVQNGSLSAGGAQFVDMLRSNSRGFSLRDLPPDVARMVMTSRHETAMAILDTWSKSIEEQAKLDKEAAERSSRMREMQGPSGGFDVSRSQRLLARVCVSAEARGIDRSALENIRERAGIADTERTALAPTTERRSTGTFSLIEGLPPPGRTGVAT